MLQNHTGPKPLVDHWYMVVVQLEEGGHTSPEDVQLRLASELRFMEGTGETQIDYMGPLEGPDPSSSPQTP